MKRLIAMLALTLLAGARLCASPQIQPQQPPAQPPAAEPPLKIPPRETQTQSTPQKPPVAQRDTRGRIVVRSDLVLVPVTVKDRQGQLIGDLQRDDFRVFSDNVEQQIILFSAEAFPLSAVVLVDNDLAEGHADQVQKSLTAIAAGFGPSDEVALVSFAQFPNVISDFSYNNDALFTQLKRLDLNSHPSTTVPGPTVLGPTPTNGPVINGQPVPMGTGPAQHGAGRYTSDKDIDDAVYAAAEMLKGRGRDRRKIIFLITDGNDSGQNVHSFDETLHLLLANDVSVYAIFVTRSLPAGKFLLQKGVSKVDKYAMGSGGDKFFASKDASLGRLYPAVAEQARNQYTLAFTPQDITKNVDYHSIEVRVRRPDLSVYAREGFYLSSFSAGH
jgi:VWFA-related protein